MAPTASGQRHDPTAAEAQRGKALEHLRLLRPFLQESVPLTHIAAASGVSHRTLRRHFRDFLADTVNLKATRVTLLEDSVESIKGAVRGFAWKPRIRSFAAHGSWAHQTIIRPVEGTGPPRFAAAWDAPSRRSMCAESATPNRLRKEDKQQLF
jgi:hypothetical protein